MTVAELLREGAGRLEARAGLPSPAREARWLLAATLHRPEPWLLAHGEAAVDAEQTFRFRAAIDRRRAGEPAHQIVGTCPFWGRGLVITPDVLIPRPETEQIVAAALALPLPPQPRILDVGTGSGCLAVTLALEIPGAEVAATEISLPALAVARGNAGRLGARIGAACGDLAAHIGGGFDLVVANLPYVPSEDIASLAPEVRDFEPRVALDGGADGASLLRRFIADLPRLLAPGGHALLEVGPDHAGLLASAVRAAGLAVVERVRDAGGVDRVLLLRRPHARPDRG